MCPQGPKNICIFSFQRDLKLQYELFKLVLNILSSLLNTNGCFKHISLLGKKKLCQGLSVIKLKGNPWLCIIKPAL